MIKPQTTETIDRLNRLFRLIYRSLPVYLEAARPWAEKGRESTVETLARMAAEDRALAERIAQAIRQEGGQVEPGQFPAEFAALHDLSADFLLRKARALLERDLPVIKECVYELSRTVSLQPLLVDLLHVVHQRLATLQEIPHGE